MGLDPIYAARYTVVRAHFGTVIGWSRVAEALRAWGVRMPLAPARLSSESIIETRWSMGQTHTMSDAHVAWTVAGGAFELVGLALIYAGIRRRQRDAEVPRLVRDALAGIWDRAAGYWEAAWQEVKRTIENPAPRAAELQGSASATGSATGVLTAGGVVNETPLEVLQRQVTKLTERVAEQGVALETTQHAVQRQLEEAQRDFRAELMARDEELRRRAVVDTRLEAFGSALFVLGLLANVVANFSG